TITARALDAAGNPTTRTVTVNREKPVDRTAPLVAITTPDNDLTTTDETVLVSGTASDPGDYPSGIAHVYLGDAEVPYNSQTGTWAAPAPVALVVGPNTVTARAVDAAGNPASVTITVTRRPPPDRTAPELAITSPDDTSTTQEETVNVSGTVSDPGPYASGVASVKVNGRSATIDPVANTWTLAGLPLELRANQITAEALDHAGNPSTHTITVTRIPPPDVIAPVVQIIEPADNFVSTTPTVTVRGTAVDNGPYATGVRQVTVNDQPASYNPTTHEWSITVTLVEGPNPIHVVAEDNAPTPNRGPASVNVTLRTPDTLPPAVSITSPVASLETYDAALNLAGTAIDDGLNAAGVLRVTVNGREAAFDPATGQWTLANFPLDFGENIIRAVAVDKAPAQNQGAAEVRVTRLRVPAPSLALRHPQNGGVYSSNTITVAGSVASLSPDPLSVTVNGEPASLSGGSFARTVALEEGANTITVAVTDSLGQRTQTSVSVLRDQSAPTVSFGQMPDLVQPGATYQITVEAADNVGVAEVEFSLDGTRVASLSAAPYVFTLSVPSPLAAGQVLTLTAVARDLSGATSVATAQARTSGPGGLSGYVFDDATGYVLAGARAAVEGEASATTDEGGVYSLVSARPSGVVRVSKDGYTAVERIFNVTPGEGSALFDARLTPLDARANPLGAAGGTALGDGERLRADFPAGSLGATADVRLTSVSPQGLANLLPYGWSPVPGAVVDVRAGVSSSAAFQTPVRLKVAKPSASLAGLTLTLARYDEQAHGWRVVATNLAPAADGSLEADLERAGQYAFVVADAGATAPPAPAAGQQLPSARPADSSALDAATATASALPRTAAYSAQARSTISFVATAPAQLPSGVAIEATFGETYTLLGGKDAVLVDRPAQDFVLYAFPAGSAEQPNRLAASFVAKPTRTDFSLADLLNANVHVEIRSGRQARTGVLVGESGGTVRTGDGATLNVAAGSVGSPQPVFFESVAPESAGLSLPEGYEVVALYDLNLGGASLARGATISLPLPPGDNSRVVVARLVGVGGRFPKVVARAAEVDGRLVTTTAAPHVPAGVSLAGVTAGGRYAFIRVPRAFGYVAGTVADAAAGGPAALVKVTTDQTPFSDVTGADGRYVVLGGAGAADAGANQIGAAAVQTDATGRGAASLAAQDAVAALNLQIASVALRVESVSPAAGAAGVIVTTPVTVTFNKPVAQQTLTGSAFRLTTAGNNPVLGSISVLAGGRVAVFTP
ncbi:MAG TPA: Ig-like domain-containing protein, partial [Pyrinomonadaceae bacterium]|nr:Ig-like domain-containing protein [Pyrinomonadaceae bacterium]